MTREELLTQLLREVMRSPVSHVGARSHRGKTEQVRRYTAKRLDDELLAEIRKVLA